MVKDVGEICDAIVEVQAGGLMEIRAAVEAGIGCCVEGGCGGVGGRVLTLWWGGLKQLLKFGYGVRLRYLLLL